MAEGGYDDPEFGDYDKDDTYYDDDVDIDDRCLWCLMILCRGKLQGRLWNLINWKQNSKRKLIKNLNKVLWIHSILKYVNDMGLNIDL